MTFHEHRLSNGLRVVVEVMPDVESAAAGFLVRTGARDEAASQAGVSHFLEHMMFKGTAKRTWREINVDFDRMGSTYNAFTSKDRTVYYGWVPSDRLFDQMELLADMLRPAIPPAEFDMEKNVILEEIAMSRDRIESLAFDLLMEHLFAEQSLSWPVLGYQETVRDLVHGEMTAYFNRRYAPENMVLIVAGRVEPERIFKEAERLCGGWAAGDGVEPRRAPSPRHGSAFQVEKRFGQQVIVVGVPAASGSSDDFETAQATSTILGGENSRFYWNIIQKGLSPRGGVFHYDFADAGVMLFWLMCDPGRANEAFDAMLAEVRAFQAGGARKDETDRVRNKRLTGLAIEAEAPYHRLTQIMDDVDYRGVPRTVEERLRQVEAVTPDAVASYLNRFPVTALPMVISVGPLEQGLAAVN